MKKQQKGFLGKFISGIKSAYMRWNAETFGSTQELEDGTKFNTSKKTEDLAGSFVSTIDTSYKITDTTPLGCGLILAQTELIRNRIEERIARENDYGPHDSDKTTDVFIHITRKAANHHPGYLQPETKTTFGMRVSEAELLSKGSIFGIAIDASNIADFLEKDR